MTGRKCRGQGRWRRSSCNALVENRCRRAHVVQLSRVSSTQAQSWATLQCTVAAAVSTRRRAASIYPPGNQLKDCDDWLSIRISARYAHHAAAKTRCRAFEVTTDSSIRAMLLAYVQPLRREVMLWYDAASADVSAYSAERWKNTDLASTSEPSEREETARAYECVCVCVS
jgi:hypothetical protein